MCQLNIFFCWSQFAAIFTCFNCCSTDLNWFYLNCDKSSVAQIVWKLFKLNNYIFCFKHICECFSDYILGCPFTFNNILFILRNDWKFYYGNFGPPFDNEQRLNIHLTNFRRIKLCANEIKFCHLSSELAVQVLEDIDLRIAMHSRQTKTCIWLMCTKVICSYAYS